jgi:DNA processing protein
VYADFVEETGSALRVLEQELERDQHSDTLFELGPRRSRVDISAALDGAASEIAEWTNDGIKLISVLDPQYPDNLRAVYDRPPLLFLAGQITAADSRSVSVIGSRNPSAAGIGATETLVTELVEAGYTIVSGLAAGIDTAAHTTTLALGGRTLAVLGTGVRKCYPPQNAELALRIAGEGGLVSQFWPDSPPARRNFPMRNAVMSGMTCGTVIVEATQISGTRVQARLALAQGRPVFLFAPLLRQPWARELSRRPGTHVVDGAAQVVDVLGRLAGDDELVADRVAAGAQPQ